MHRSPLLRAVTAATLLTFAAGAAEAQNGGSRSGGRRSASAIDTTIAFDHQGTVAVENGTEAIVVTGWDQNRVRVQSRGAVTVDVRGAQVTVSPRQASGGGEPIEVSVPRGVRVIAHSRSGAITIHATSGDVEAHAVDGDVELTEVSAADIHTLNGDVAVSGVMGKLQAQTVSGSITIADARGDVDVNTVSGDIVITGAVSRHVRAQATAGEVTFGGSIDQNGVYELISHSGDVKLLIPRDAGAQVTASTWSGSIRSDFPITLRPGEVTVGPGGKQHSTAASRAAFQIGKGGGHITVDTFSGDITISARGKP